MARSSLSDRLALGGAAVLAAYAYVIGGLSAAAVMHRIEIGNLGDWASAAVGGFVLLATIRIATAESRRQVRRERERGVAACIYFAPICRYIENKLSKTRTAISSNADWLASATPKEYLRMKFARPELDELIESYERAVELPPLPMIKIIESIAYARALQIILDSLYTDDPADASRVIFNTEIVDPSIPILLEIDRIIESCTVAHEEMNVAARMVLSDPDRFPAWYRPESD